MDVDEMPSLRFGLVAAEMGVESHDDERSDNESCLSDPSDPYQGDTTEPFAPDYGDLDDYADDFDEGHTERSHQENYTEDEVDADGIDDGGFDVVSPRAPSARNTQGFNFGRAKVTLSSKAVQRSEQRAKDLRTLIELNAISINLFEQAPMSEYELYMRNYGSSGTSQIGIQSVVDSTNSVVQTIPIKTRTKWTQHPPSELRAVGGDLGGSSSGAPTAAAVHDDDDLGRVATATSSVAQSAQRRRHRDMLARFLARAGGVCSTLLDESAARGGSTVADAHAMKGKTVFSDQSTRLPSTSPLVAGRYVHAATFAPTHPSLLLLAYGPLAVSPEATVDVLRQREVLCLWDTRQPSSPLKVLTCESVPTCCCFDPLKASLALAATVDGTIQLWDLREPPALHKKHKINGGTQLLRTPTYSTAGVAATSNHEAPIVAMETVASAVGSAHAAATSPLEQRSGHRAFQLATLDVEGVFKTWTVVEVRESDPSGSLQDLGLLPGGRVKITPSATVVLASPRQPHPEAGIETTCLRLCPTHPHRLLAGTSNGTILHSVRFGTRCSPRAYCRPGAANVPCGCRLLCPVHSTRSRYVLMRTRNDGDGCADLCHGAMCVVYTSVWHQPGGGCRSGFSSVPTRILPRSLCTVSYLFLVHSHGCARTRLLIASVPILLAAYPFRFADACRIIPLRSACFSGPLAHNRRISC
eukprot:m.526377 g.526377  ORF g.526377 m.526377 type:complete len:698 (+) comp22001_c0_seq43:292-2385(+)